jgi:hypothetical protein
MVVCICSCNENILRELPWRGVLERKFRLAVLEGQREAATNKDLPPLVCIFEVGESKKFLWSCAVKKNGCLALGILGTLWTTL